MWLRRGRGKGAGAGAGERREEGKEWGTTGFEWARY